MNTFIQVLLVAILCLIGWKVLNYGLDKECNRVECEMNYWKDK